MGKINIFIYSITVKSFEYFHKDLKIHYDSFVNISKNVINNYNKKINKENVLQLILDICDEYKKISDNVIDEKTDIIIDVYDNKINILSNGRSKTLILYTYKNDNCVNRLVEKVLIPKVDDIINYLNYMKDDNDERSKINNYHKSIYFDKDMMNLRNIKEECLSIIEKIDKFKENITFANYTE